MILRQIADCDAFIAIVSRSTLDSVACRREREWALKLNKPVLPVAVERVLEAALPGELSRLEIVDYSTLVDAAFALAGALSGLGRHRLALRSGRTHRLPRCPTSRR